MGQLVKRVFTKVPLCKKIFTKVTGKVTNRTFCCVFILLAFLCRKGIPLRSFVLKFRNLLNYS